jgi:hypothetical protein
VVTLRSLGEPFGRTIKHQELVYSRKRLPEFLDKKPVFGNCLLLAGLFAFCDAKYGRDLIQSWGIESTTVF